MRPRSPVLPACLFPCPRGFGFGGRHLRRAPRGLVAVAALSWSLTALPFSPPAAGAEEEPESAAAVPLRLERVLLSTGGVGLFDLSAEVTGPARLSLSVPVDQVDDLLKSLTLSDPGGRPASVRLAGRRPLAEVFRGLPFAPEALDSPAALLAALKGERVTVSGPRAVTGQVVAVTEETARDPQTPDLEIRRHRLTLLTAEGLRQVIVEDSDTLAFADPEITQAVATALTALADLKARDSRRLTIALTGETAETRRVRAAYVAEVPLWKASYRLTLPPEERLTPGPSTEAAAGAGTPEDEVTGRLVGWGTLENLSGQDWESVSLTVLSGAPVTFRQDLYTPYRVDRPLVPVEVQGRILPPADAGTLPGRAGGDGAASGAEAGAGGVVGAMAERARAARDEEAPMAFAPVPEPVPSSAPRAQLFDAVRPDATPDGKRAQTAEAEAGLAQVVFAFPDPISLKRGETLNVPLLDRDLPVTRVAHVLPPQRAGGLGRHPLAALRLVNTSGTALPPGAVSLTQHTPQGLAYLGDARLSALPAGEDRLLAFAIDQEVTVDRETRQDQTIAGLTAAGGVLTLKRVLRAETLYGLHNAGAAPRQVVLDHPRRSGWSLIPPEDLDPPPREAADSHRLVLTLAPGETRRLSVVLEYPQSTRIDAGALTDQTLAGLSASGALSAEERRVAEDLAQRAARVAEYENHADHLTREKEEVLASQDHLRDNLKTVPRDSDLHDRFMDRLGRLDDRLVSLEEQIAEARAEARKAHAELEAFVRGLSLP